MSDNKFMLRDQNDDLTICLSEPKDTDLVLVVYSGGLFDRVRIITEYDFVYYTTHNAQTLFSGIRLEFRRSCFDILSEMTDYDSVKDVIIGFQTPVYYIMTYAEIKKLTPQEFQIRIQYHRAYNINEIMDQIEIRRKELLPELFG